MFTPEGFNGDDASEFDYEAGQSKPLTTEQQSAADDYRIEMAELAASQPPQNEIAGLTW